MGDDRRVRAVIQGRVQGVFFRATLQDRAEALGLAGWVRNAAEGHVEAELQGDAQAVEKALAYCHEGPPGASVERVEVEEVHVLPGASGFRIR